MTKVIISDTSCLIALAKIDKLHLLRDLYHEILITKDVYHEFGGILPEWFIVSDVVDKEQQKKLEDRLDRGEASSIALALEKEKSTLIIDEVKGRKVAQSLNIDIIGTIGIILLAEKMGHLSDVVGTILKLVNQGFRLSDQLIDLIIKKYSRE